MIERLKGFYHFNNVIEEITYVGKNGILVYGFLYTDKYEAPLEYGMVKLYILADTRFGQFLQTSQVNPEYWKQYKERTLEYMCKRAHKETERKYDKLRSKSKKIRLQNGLIH